MGRVDSPECYVRGFGSIAGLLLDLGDWGERWEGSPKPRLERLGSVTSVGRGLGHDLCTIEMIGEIHSPPILDRVKHGYKGGSRSAHGDDDNVIT